MLRLITGGNRSDRENVFIDSVKQSVVGGKDVLVIIPDQFSFEYDKKLYDALGAKSFNKIQTAGFNRLAELIAKKYGGDSRNNADNNAVIITMYKAICRLKSSDDVRFYKKALGKNSFLSEIIDLVNELSESGITAEDLRIASENNDGLLSMKLFDISRLFEYYNQELEKAGLKDSLTSLQECCALSDENNSFENKCVFIDSFSDFSVDEYKIIELMLKQCEDVTVSLLISHENKAKTNKSPFAETIRTARKLKDLAKIYNIDVNEIKTRSSFNRHYSGIEYIDENLYASVRQTDKPNDVKIIAATDVYEEIEYVCSEISRLVREENYHYKNIALMTGNVQNVSSVIEGVFERYEIPYFIDSNHGAAQSALVIYLRSIFDCVLTKHWSTEKLLKYAKSPLSHIFDYDISDLEDYCITWNVNGDMWLEDFTASSGEGSSLSRINKTRAEIIEPLSEFKNSCNNASSQDICVALYKLLNDIKLSEQMFSKVKLASCNENNGLQWAREFKQLWQTVLSAVSAIYQDMCQENMSLREFNEIFSLMISQMTVSNPPQKVDSVRIASTEHSRLSDVKAVFVIEANDGVFPGEVKSSGLFTNVEKRQLEKQNLNMADNALRQIESQRYKVYSALTLARVKLYLTYSESDSQGALKRPSLVVGMLKKMFGDDVESKCKDMPLDFFCVSYRTALYKYLEKNGDNTVEVATLKQSLMNTPVENKIAFIESSVNNNIHKLSDEMAKKLFFNHDMNLSATRVKDYYSCPFLYFCKYGLKLKKPLPVVMNPVNTGNLIHNCFEKIMSKTDDNGKSKYNSNFPKLSDDIIRKCIHDEFREYINTNLGGDFGKTAGFNESLKRLEDSAFFAIKNIQTELEDSLFLPQAFEYDLTKENGESILHLKLDNDIYINIRGSIDRADVFTSDDGQRYIRIIDYKTGDTTLRLEELYNGLNLQMLIYLLAVTQRKNDLNVDGNLKPSAILYSHINFVKAGFTPKEISALKSGDALDEALLKKRASAYKPDGMMIENEFTFEALNKRFAGVFTPFSFTSKGVISSRGNQPVSEEYFCGLEQFALEKLCEMAQKLKCGDICADPIKTSKSLTCSYCDYWAICGNSAPKNPRTVDKSDIDKLNERIESYYN